ncbi:hypothetical protein [Vallitalea okinawensis]|nr:hypothetical protein [Vallitalea okinawensis]
MNMKIKKVTKKSLKNAVIMAEVLGAPRARKPRRTVNVKHTFSR